MARVCKLGGGLLVALGLVVLLLSLGALRRDRESYGRAALAAERNAGNVMYEAELGKASLRRAFEVVGATFGILFALNGATLVALGVVASRRAPGSITRHDAGIA
jgi:hypothetical protein